MDPRQVIKQKGYTTQLIVEKNQITIHVNKNGESFGQIEIYKGQKYWQTYSSDGIPSELRGKGVGLYLYKRLIRYGLKKGFMIRSADFNMRNEYSNAIWKKLCKVFKVEKRHGRYYVVGS